MKNNKFLFLLTISSFLFLMLSCSQNTFDDIKGETEPLPEFVTYQDIKPTIDNLCLNCHSSPPQNGAPMPLITYDMVKEAVQNRDLLDRISRIQGADGFMPLGGPRLSQETITLFFKWQEDGLLEN